MQNKVIFEIESVQKYKTENDKQRQKYIQQNVRRACELTEPSSQKVCCMLCSYSYTGHVMNLWD